MTSSHIAQASIGIFDSGIGGLTVMRAIRNLLPHENIVYFGDTGRVPYGNKSAETITRYSLENARLLMDYGIKILVIACHTVCTNVLDQLPQIIPVPTLGVVQPSIDQLIQHTHSGHIAILGTRATISSGVYQKLLQSRLPHAAITAIPCPLFVPLVEEGYMEHPMTELVVQEYLRPLRAQNIDAVLLGCTHYPFLHHLLQKELGANTVLVDPATACAESVRALLTKCDILNPQKDLPHYQFLVSDDPEKFRLLGTIFLNYPIEHIRKIG